MTIQSSEVINIYNKYMYLLHLLLFIHSLRDYIYIFKTNQCCMRIRFQKHLLLHNFYHNFIRKDPKKNQRAISAILLFHLLSLVWVFPCEDKKQVFRRCKIFFSPERRMQNSCRGFVTAGNPDKSAPYAGAFVS